VRSSALLNENLTTKLIITPSKAFWTAILSPSNLNWISPTFTVLKMRIRPSGRWFACIIEVGTSVVLRAVLDFLDNTSMRLSRRSNGCPEVIVSDSAGVFRANHYLAILEGLDIEPKCIEKGEPWQNLIESQFKIQLRLADFKFEQAKTFEEIQDRHTEFVETFNTTAHYAHQEREDGRRTPAQVLDWVRGRIVDPEQLQRLFQVAHDLIIVWLGVDFVAHFNEYAAFSCIPKPASRRNSASTGEGLVAFSCSKRSSRSCKRVHSACCSVGRASVFASRLWAACSACSQRLRWRGRVWKRGRAWAR
jgi:hypothetical protein